MRRLLGFMAIVATASLCAVAIAGASNGSGTAFKAEYPTGTAYWTCAGAHVVNKNVTKDDQWCTISGDTAGYVAGSYSGSPSGALPPYGNVAMQSDFNGALASSWTADITDNGDGTFEMHLVLSF